MCPDCDTSVEDLAHLFRCPAKAPHLNGRPLLEPEEALVQPAATVNYRRRLGRIGCYTGGSGHPRLFSSHMADSSMAVTRKRLPWVKKTAFDDSSIARRPRG